jgi:hypothetical protein
MSGLPEKVRLGLLRDSNFFDKTRVSPPPVWGFGAATSGGIISLLFLPYWPVVLLASTLAVLGVLPWLRWRFSLRTLLIATTLVALVLGAIVYAVR